MSDRPIRSIAAAVTVAALLGTASTASAHELVKQCRYGRRHLRDSRGRRFTMCRAKPTPIAVRIPHFTG
jgi:hypothetical protein